MAAFAIGPQFLKIFSGTAHTAGPEREIRIRLRDLAFENGHCASSGRAVFVPAEPGAMSALYDICPPEEWTYTYYTDRCYYPDGAACRPRLHLEIRNRRTGRSMDAEFCRLTGEDHDYLRRLFLKAMPGIQIAAAEEYYMGILSLDKYADF